MVTIFFIRGSFEAAYIDAAPPIESPTKKILSFSAVGLFSIISIHALMSSANFTIDENPSESLLP